MSAKNLDIAILAAGCFWGVEDTLMKLNGVKSTEVGYIGGKTTNPTYKEVCTDMTGHAEAVKIVFDSKVVSYRQILTKFFEIHDPTTLNQQGPDVGSQYRSAIFYLNSEQREKALRLKSELNESGRFKKPVITQIVPALTFYPAEEYHQKYFQKKGISHC
jgi:peptide-methionine (S)-S-oxide reductase